MAVNSFNAQNPPVNTKGDLFTFSTIPTRLGVGSNGDTLVADSSATTGLRWQSAANQNFVINGGMDIWQRGTSFTGTSPYYSADRFVAIRVFASSGATFSRQTSGLTNFQYSIRAQRNSGNTSTDGLIISQCLESATSYPLAGQTVTLSFYAKCGANYSSASSALSSQIRYGTGTDQNYITGSYTGDTQVVAGTHTLTTSWQRFYITGTVNSAATEVGFDLRYTPVGTASTNDWFEITGVQLELGSVPTTFKRAGGTLAGELAACQRYYYRSGQDNLTTPGAYCRHAFGYTTSTTNAFITLFLPTTMRTNASSVDFANLQMQDSSGSQFTVTNVTIDSSTTGNKQTGLNCTVSGATSGRMAAIQNNNNTGGYVAVSAEL